MKRATNHRNRVRAVWGGARRAFTIVEATIVIGIIALLAGILLLAIGGARKKGDVVAEQVMVTSLQKVVEQFKQERGFLPPLVVDNLPALSGIATVPVFAAGAADVGIAVWSIGELSNISPTLNTMWPARTPFPAHTLDSTEIASGASRCSEYSLAYYVIGALDGPADGVDGLGFTAPARDGSFSRKGRKFDALIDPTQQKTRRGTIRLSIPTSNAGSPQARTIAKARCVIFDRWSDGTAANSNAIRYYRWLPTYFPQGVANAGQVQFWNVPVAAGGYLDPANGHGDPSKPPTKAELKSAEYAIVSAGPNHAFGDEPLATLVALLGVLSPTPDSPEEATLRAKAIADNIIEVGR